MNTDFDEDEIWNYKSTAKDKLQVSKVSKQETVCARISVKQRRKVNSGAKKTCTAKTWSAKEDILKEKLVCDTLADVMNKKGVGEVINMESENELVCLYLPVDKNRKNVSNTKDSSNAFGRSSTVMSVSLARTKLGNCKLKSPTARSKTKTTRSVKGSTLSTPEKRESVQCPGIKKYFSPSGDKREKKRKSSESVNSLFEFTVDELMFVQEETAGTCPKKQMKLSESLEHDNVCHMSSLTTLNCSLENVCNSIQEEVGNITVETVVSTDLMKIDCHVNMFDENMSHLTADLQIGDDRPVDKSAHCLITSHDKVTGLAFVTSLDAGDCGIEDSIEVHTFRDRFELETSCLSGEISDCALTAVVPECGGHLVKSNSLSDTNIANALAIEGKAVMKASSSVAQTHSPSVAQTHSPSVAQIHSPSVAQTHSPSVAQTHSPSVAQTLSPSVAQTHSPSVAQTHSPSVAQTLSPIVAQTHSQSANDKQCILPNVQKQTSIFSFFKARVGSSCKTAGSMSNKLSDVSDISRRQTVHSSRSKVSVRPTLNQSRTLSVATPTKGGNFCMQSVIASASNTAVRKEPEEQQQQCDTRSKRQCPFYKKIHNTGISVDAFSYGVVPGCEAYILTHFHYDHYGGLTKRFAQPIYCSQVTGNLVEHRLGVDKKWINRLQLWKPYLVAGVTLTLIEANHCPGAVMVLFELKDGRTVLHTGDFRACLEMERYPMLKRAVTTDIIYLDTTYCSPSYNFPTQYDVINFAVSLVLTYVTQNPDTLIICGTYTIGKEKIFKAIAEALNSKICVTRDKKKVLDCLDDIELQARVTLDWSQGQVHVLPMGKLNQKALFEHHSCHPKFTSVLALEPTGWSHSSKTSLEVLSPKWSSNNVTLYGIPYSEHSSYLELKHFIQFLRPKKIIPTVNNGNPAARKKMEDIFGLWTQENLASHGTSFATCQDI